jgi:hypothetical protein
LHNYLLTLCLTNDESIPKVFEWHLVATRRRTQQVGKLQQLGMPSFHVERGHLRDGYILFQGCELSSTGEAFRSWIREDRRESLSGSRAPGKCSGLGYRMTITLKSIFHSIEKASSIDGSRYKTFEPLSQALSIVISLRYLSRANVVTFTHQRPASLHPNIRRTHHRF